MVTHKRSKRGQEYPFLAVYASLTVDCLNWRWIRLDLYETGHQLRRLSLNVLKVADKKGSAASVPMCGLIFALILLHVPGGETPLINAVVCLARTSDGFEAEPDN